MAHARSAASGLAKLLNAATQPIYVLDHDSVLVFCNRACLEWVGQTAEDLHGRRCAYHSDPDVNGPDAVAAGLCPSPAVMAGTESSGTVACVDPQGRLHRRRARFLRLGSGPAGVLGLIAVVDAEDLPEDETGAPPPPEDEAAWLHNQIRILRQRAAGRVRIDRLFGESPAMRRVRAQVALAAQSDASVLLVGPPGSGRQHLAEAIHYGGRSQPPGSLVPLACSVLGAELIRSTVAALASRRPAREAAGTLLLNEADQLPAEVQADLARVLSARSFPMRLIATAREPLKDLASRGAYREELALLLSTLVIELPPLACRRGDLPVLAQVFLEEANARGTKQLAGFSPEALDRLDGYWWPGNLDELAQVVAEAHRAAQGPRIEVSDLPERIHLASYAAAHPRRPDETIVLDEFLAQIERELITRAMGRAKGNKTQAARLLGMTRPRLYRRLVQLGMAEPSADDASTEQGQSGAPAANDSQQAHDAGTM